MGGCSVVKFIPVSDQFVNGVQVVDGVDYQELIWINLFVSTNKGKVTYTWPFQTPIGGAR